MMSANKEIINIFFDENWNLNISVHWIIYISLIIILLIIIYKILNSNLYFKKNFEIDSAEIGIKGQKIKIKPNHINIDIAYKIWVELNTRKIGLEIDFENDVIIEIYNSWYNFFGITRDLMKELPASKIRRDNDTKELIVMSTRVLNEGLRPHLTTWQAKYRKWNDSAMKLESNNEKTPQEIQQSYPQYELLKTDMIRINKNLIKYKNLICKLAFEA